MSKVNKPVSLSKLIKLTKGREGGIAVIVGTVTDDIRVHEVPMLKVTALRFTELVRAKIVKAGAECLTFDQLALLAPLGQNTTVLPSFGERYLSSVPFQELREEAEKMQPVSVD